MREYRVSVSLPNRTFDLIWECCPDELANKLSSISTMLSNTGIYPTHPYEINIRVEDKGKAKID